MHARLSLVLVLLTGSPVLADNRLSRADAEQLDALIPAVLFDPVGAERVRVKLPGDSVYLRTAKALVAHDGWLVRGKIYFTDGFAIPAPPSNQVERIDFIKQATRFFGAVPPPGADTVQWIHLTAREVFGDVPSFLALAAWYHRLGHDDHAAAALDIARAIDENPLMDLRRRLGTAAYEATGSAFRAGNDTAALAVGEHFLRRYAGVELFRDDMAEEVRAVVADARRRLTRGRLGTGPAQARVEPGTTGPVERRLVELIEGLEDVSAASVGRYPWIHPEEPLVVRLLALGEAAVPALIDVLERDDRLTRGGPSQLGRCCFGSRRPGLELVPVRDLAEDALIGILRLHEFPPVPNEAEDMNLWVRTAGRMRLYWKTYGGLAPDDRMMRLLTDPDVPPALGLEAARNLARRAERASTGWRRETDRRASGPQPRHPIVGRYERPTAARAIQAAADRDYAALAARDGSNHMYFWLIQEERYLDALVELGDERIGPELARRAPAVPDPGLRRQYALAAHALGASSAIQQFARDAARGAIPLESAATTNERWTIDPRIVELRWIVEALVSTGGPDADAALQALTDSRHPYAKVLTDALRVPRDTPEFRHPFYLTVFRRDLANLTPTGRGYKRDGDVVEDPGGGRFTFPGDANGLLPEAEERVCDEAGYRLSQRILGAPFFHALRPDADVQLPRLMDFYDTHRRRLRLATEEESALLGANERATFIPDIKPLGRPATAVDVKSGAAVFHLNGKGRVWTGPLPKQVRLKAEAKDPRPGLVVQVEADADGKAVYGVIFRNEIRKVRADEIE